MKILAICGSPRKGNTEFILNTILEEIKDHEKELILLRNKKIEHCTGCDACYNQGEDCYINDDMKEIIPKLLQSDLIIFGTPNYFKNVSSLMKVFMDRTNEIVGQHKLKNKKAVIICVGGQELTNTQYCENILKGFVEDHKMILIESFKARAEGPNETKEGKGIIETLKDIGKKINNIK